MIRLIALAFTLLVALPAYAANPKIDQAGADALTPRITQSLNSFAASFAQSGITMTQTGKLLVEPAGDYYAITTPSIALVMPGGITRTVGMVAVNAIPTSDPDVFKVAVALPTPMLDTDATGKNVGSLSIGQQSMNGLWNMSDLSFVELNGDYKNVSDLGPGTQTAIAALTISMKLTPKGNLWSGPAEVIMTNYDHRDAQQAYNFAAIHMRMLLTDIDMAVQRSIANNVRGAGDLTSVAADFVTKLLSRADVIFDAQNLSYQTAGDDGKTNAGTVKLISLQGTLTDIKTGLANAAYTGTADGFTSQNSPAQLVPTHVAIKGSATRLPLAQVLTATDSAALKAVLQKSGTHVIVDNFTMDAPGYGLEGNGNITPSTTAPMGVGKIHIGLRGIDALTAYLSSPEGAAAMGPNMAAGNLVAVLAVVQMTGQPGKDSQGRDIRSYDLVMTADGHISMNGNDMTAVTQSLNAKSGAAPVIDLNRP